MKYLKNKDILNFKFSKHNKNFCVIQKIADKLGVEKYTVTPDIKEKYNKFSYEGEVLPSLYQFTKSFPKLTNEISKIAFLKKKDFYLPSRTDEYIKKLDAIIKDTPYYSTESVFLCPSIVENETKVIRENNQYLQKIFQNKTKEIIEQYPDILKANKQDIIKIQLILKTYLNFKNLDEEFDFIRKNPLLIILDSSKLFKFLNVLNNHLIKAKNLSKKNIEKANFKREVDKEDIYKIKILGDKLNSPVSLPIEEEILKLELSDILNSNPYMLFTSTDNLENMFKIFKEKVGVDEHLAFYLLRRCPDIFYLNTHNLFEKKIDLLLKLDMDRFQVKNLIKHYPFMLVKSFSSFVKKYNFIKNDCGYTLKGDLDIYPLILIFDFNTEILPKLTILKRIDDFQRMLKSGLTRISDSDQKNKYFSCKLITVSQAFSLSKEDFCKEVNIDQEEYDSLIGQDESKNDYIFPNLQERDVLFYYSKYKGI